MGVKVREKKKGSNVWWVYVNHGGQRRARRIGAKREAEDYAKEIRRGIAVGAFLKRESKSTVTFGEYAETFMAGHVANNLKRSTEKSYGANLEKHILPVFRDHPIVDITRKDIKESATPSCRGAYRCRRSRYWSPSYRRCSHMPRRTASSP